MRARLFAKYASLDWARSIYRAIERQPVENSRLTPTLCAAEAIGTKHTPSICLTSDFDYFSPSYCRAQSPQSALLLRRPCNITTMASKHFWKGTYRIDALLKPDSAPVIEELRSRFGYYTSTQRTRDDYLPTDRKLWTTIGVLPGLRTWQDPSVMQDVLAKYTSDRRPFTTDVARPFVYKASRMAIPRDQSSRREVADVKLNVEAPLLRACHVSLSESLKDILHETQESRLRDWEANPFYKKPVEHHPYRPSVRIAANVEDIMEVSRLRVEVRKALRQKKATADIIGLRLSNMPRSEEPELGGEGSRVGRHWEVVSDHLFQNVEG